MSKRSPANPFKEQEKSADSPEIRPIFLLDQAWCNTVLLPTKEFPLDDKYAEKEICRD